MILKLELVNTFGRAVAAEIILRRETIEVRYEERLVGVCDRDTMHDWLREPNGQLLFDETSFVPVPGGVALAIESKVLCWPLPDQTVACIRECV